MDYELGTRADKDGETYRVKVPEQIPFQEEMDEIFDDVLERAAAYEEKLAGEGSYKLIIEGINEKRAEDSWKEYKKDLSEEIREDEYNSFFYPATTGLAAGVTELFTADIAKLPHLYTSIGATIVVGGIGIGFHASKLRKRKEKKKKRLFDQVKVHVE